MKTSKRIFAKHRLVTIAVGSLLIAAIAGAMTGSALGQGHEQTVNCNAMPHMWSASEDVTIDDAAGTVTFLWSLPEQAAPDELPDVVPERRITVDINAKNCNRQPGLEDFLATIRAQSAAMIRTDCAMARATLEEVQEADDSQWGPDGDFVILAPLEADDPESLARRIFPDQLEAALTDEC